MLSVGSGDSTVNPSHSVNRLKELIGGSPPKICVIRGEGIGDVLMTTPTVHALTQMFPRCQITYVTNMDYLGGALGKVLQFNPDIHKVIDRNFYKKDDYDLAINLHCPCFGYEKKENPPINRIDLFASHCGIQLVDTRPKYYIQQDEILAGQFLITQGKNLLVQVSASSEKRTLNHLVLKQTLINLYNKYKIHSIILSYSDQQTDMIWGNIPGAVNLVDKDIRQVAGIMTNCDLVLCMDSALLHLAGALDIPSVSLFGPTHPLARINHYPKALAVWGAKDLKCGPCWLSSCEMGYSCWGNITPEKIEKACLMQLNKYLKAV